MSRGFSLVQVMVAAGVLGGLSLVLMQIAQNQGQILTFAEAKSEEIEITNQVRIILSREQACKETFQGRELDDDIEEIININGDAVFEINLSVVPET